MNKPTFKNIPQAQETNQGIKGIVPLSPLAPQMQVTNTQLVISPMNDEITALFFDNNATDVEFGPTDVLVDSDFLFLYLTYGTSKVVIKKEVDVGKFYIPRIKTALDTFEMIPIATREIRRYQRTKTEWPPFCTTPKGGGIATRQEDNGQVTTWFCNGVPEQNIAPCPFRNDPCSTGQALFGYVPALQIRVRWDFFRTALYALQNMNYLLQTNSIKSFKDALMKVSVDTAENKKGVEWFTPRFDFIRKTEKTDFASLTTHEEATS